MFFKVVCIRDVITKLLTEKWYVDCDRSLFSFTGCVQSQCTVCTVIENVSLGIAHCEIEMEVFEFYSKTLVTAA